MREFESYGPIKQIKMITDQKTGKPRGYCFIEFEQEKDMHCKYFFQHLMLLLFTEVLKTSSGELYIYSVSGLNSKNLKPVFTSNHNRMNNTGF